MKYEDEAHKLCEAIKKLAASDEHINNFECYLGYHFADWIRRCCQTPEEMAGEFETFATFDW